MGYFSGITFVDGSTPLNASNMNALSNAIVNSVPRTGPTSTDIIDYQLHGSTDVGISALTHAISIDTGIGMEFKYGNTWNGTNDVFNVTSSFPAYQLGVSGAGISCRKSTGNCNAGSVISWGAYTILYS